MTGRLTGNAIIDSALTRKEAFKQNPKMLCPDEILEAQTLIEVRYMGFDNRQHIGQILVAESVASDVKTFFKAAQEMAFPIAKVVPAASKPYEWDDHRLMAENVSSGFNYRNIAGTDRPSLHGLGRAFDINPVQNPYIRYIDSKPAVAPEGSVWDPQIPGTLYNDHPLVRIMEGLGWEWGGNWEVKSGRVDYQHFQKP